MFIKITISSKNYNSLKNFLTFFRNVYETNNLNSKLFLKYFKQQKLFFNFTVLKSPHVNKTAQEQFKYNLFLKQIWICSFQTLKILILLKKIQLILFPDIKIQIKFYYNKKRKNKIKTKIVDPDNFKVQVFQTQSIMESKYQKIQLYLNLFDIYGEVCLQSIV